MVFKYLTQKHSFHLVDPSPWPLFTSISALMLTFGGVMYMHCYCGGFELFIKGLAAMLLCLFGWWRDIIREATFEGQHTLSVQRGLRIGFLLFIVSEIMFFFGFFFAFFYLCLNPSIALGAAWPPKHMIILNPWKIPLLNTILLLSSGVTITLAHHAICLGCKKTSTNALGITILIALIFLYLQGLEYRTAPFNITDTAYGSVFFMLTGFHGFHVFIGTCFLIVCEFRLFLNHFTRKQHLGFEMAAWYWHFVDVVWMILFITLYWWGS
jgi:cytochrome c oxidase subunit 3